MKYHHSNIFFSYTSHYSDASIKGLENIDGLSNLSVVLLIALSIFLYRKWGRK